MPRHGLDRPFALLAAIGTTIGSASIEGDPVFMRRVNGWLTVFSIVMIPVSLNADGTPC